MSKRKKIYALMRYAAAFLVVLCVYIIFNQTSRIIIRHKERRHPIIDTVKVAVSIPKPKHPDKTLKYLSGFQFDLLSDYVHSQNFPAVINFASPTVSHDIEDLRGGEVDILVVVSDSLRGKNIDSISFSIPVGRCVWAVRSENTVILDNINDWLGWYIQGEEYASLHERFNGGNVISPYDELIKKNARLIGWDWRLLAAIIRHESNFSMSVVSPRNAVGLMQILPSTAKTYGITDIFDPGENIRAGALHLARMQKYILSLEVDTVNVIPLTIAAYNCGEGRIEDCLYYVRREGGSSNWKVVASMLPKLRELPEDDLENFNLGRFNPTVTIKYVDSVMETYEEYVERTTPPTLP